MPPEQDGLAARMDPSKQRPRGFNTGKGAKGPLAAEQDMTAWHETAEQKQKRLADEMMGITKQTSHSTDAKRLSSRTDHAMLDETAKSKERRVRSDEL